MVILYKFFQIYDNGVPTIRIKLKINQNIKYKHRYSGKCYFRKKDAIDEAYYNRRTNENSVVQMSEQYKGGRKIGYGTQYYFVKYKIDI